MSQANAIPQSGPQDPAVMADAMQDAIDAINSGHLGASRPSYAVEGTLWLKEVSSTIDEIYVYDGTNDILLGYFNPTTHALTNWSLADNQVSLAKLAQVATARFLGRTTSGTGNVEAMTAAEATALLNAFVGDSGSGGTKGLVPAPASGDAAAGRFLKADGTWDEPPSGLDPGTIMDFGMDTAPAGWLACYGQAVSRATYAALYSAVGDTWGAGNGSTTFNVPDLRGRVRAGWDNMGGASANRLTNPASTTGGIDGDTFANTGGSETHALTSAQNGAHTHTGGVSGTFNEGASTNRTGGTSGNTGSSGTGDAHNNVQPTAIVLTCIKT